MTDGPRFDRDQMERIIARAVEAQASDTESFSADDVVRIAGELGIPPREVRRAMSEELRSTHSTRRGLLDTEVSATRLVDGEPDEVARRVNAWLQRHEAMRLRRRDGALQVWEKDPRPLANLRAGLGLTAGGKDLRSIGSIDVVQEPVPGGVTISMHSSGTMTRVGAGAAFGGIAVGGVSMAASLWLLVAQPWAWVYLFLPMLVLATVIGVVVVRTGTTKAERAMERALDGIAEGAPPREDSVTDVIDDLRQTWGRGNRPGSARKRTLDL